MCSGWQFRGCFWPTKEFARMKKKNKLFEVENAQNVQEDWRVRKLLRKCNYQDVTQRMMGKHLEVWWVTVQDKWQKMQLTV